MKARVFLVGLLLAAFAHPAFAARPSTLSPGEHWLAATLGHRDAGLTVLVHQPRSGKPRLRVIDLDQLGIPYSTDNFLRHRGENYVLRDALTNHEAHLDPLAGRVHFVTHVRPHKPEEVPADLLLDVRINGVLVDEPVYVRNTGSDLVLPEETLRQLRIELPEAYGPFVEDGLPVHALAGEAFHLDMKRLYLEMTIPADRFVTTHLVPAHRQSPRAITDWTPSMVIGYNLSGGENQLGNWHAGYGDVAISAGTVSCRSRHLARSGQDRVLRLDSSCIADWPRIPLSAGIGDNFTSSGSLQQSVAYGGFWIGTDYSLQPYRNLQPSLIVDGNARLPSTLEIWMDQQLGLREEIPPGPFLVDNLPAVSGSGELRAVLVDATGQQVVVSTPVYSDPRLLGSGIADWRVEAGRLRPGDFETRDIYAERFGAASVRMGITDWLTGELHIEGTRAFTTWSTNTAWRLWRLGLLEAGVSESRGRFDERAGKATVLGYSWRGDYLHAAFREIRRDRNYVSLGYPDPGSAPSLERVVSAGISAGPVSFALSGVERAFEDDQQAAHRLANATLAFRLGRVGQLLLTATQNLSAAGSEPLYGAHLSIPLGRRHHAYHSVSGSGDTATTSTGYNLSPPPGSGVGFRVNRDSYQNKERTFAETTYRGSMGVASASAERDSGGEADWGARLSGAIIASRAGAGFVRDDGNSFAMIETGPGTGNVRILHEHNAVAETNGSGAAIVSGLRPYQSNRLALKVEDLPLSGNVETNELVLVPGRRSVVIADFGFREERYVLARLKTSATAQAIPPGSQVTIGGSPAGLVGFDGTIYVSLPNATQAMIEVHWSSGSCVATLAVPAGSGVHDIGEVTCH